MTLDEMLDAAAEAPAVTIAPGWGQGRATYGGLVAGLMVARAEALCGDPSRRLRSMSTTFVGPVAPGPAVLDGRVLRAGSSATSVQVHVVQDGEVRAVLAASFGQHRDTEVRVEPDAPRPAVPGPQDSQRLPYIAGVVPDFIQHLDLRFATGSFPFSGAAEAAFGGWMRFDEPPARFTERELVALIDAWPPAISPRYDAPGPMSTLTWALELLDAPGAADDPAGHWQYDVHAVAGSGGYAQTAARIWDPAGALRAISQQTVAYFR